MRLWSESAGSSRSVVIERRRHDAVEQQAGAHGIEPDALVAQQRGAVGRMRIRRLQAEVGGDAHVPRRTAVAAGRRARSRARRPWQSACRGRRRAATAPRAIAGSVRRRLSWRNPRRFMPVSILTWQPSTRAARGRGVGEGAASPRRGDGRRQPVREDPVEIARCPGRRTPGSARATPASRRTTPSSTSAHASIVTPAASSASADRRRAMAVGVGLDDRDDRGRRCDRTPARPPRAGRGWPARCRAARRDRRAPPCAARQ